MLRLRPTLLVCSALLVVACSSSQYADKPSTEPQYSAEKGTVYGGCFRFFDAMPTIGPPRTPGGPLQLQVHLFAADTVEGWAAGKEGGWDLVGMPPSGEIATTRSGADGMFTIHWFPGEYFLFADDGGHLLVSGPFAITSGDTTRVKLIRHIVY